VYTHKKNVYAKGIKICEYVCVHIYTYVYNTSIQNIHTHVTRVHIYTYVYNTSIQNISIQNIHTHVTRVHIYTYVYNTSIQNIQNIHTYVTGNQPYLIPRHTHDFHSSPSRKNTLF